MNSSINIISRKLVTFAATSILSASALGGCIETEGSLAREMDENVAESSQALAVGCPTTMAGNWDFHHEDVPSGDFTNNAVTLNDSDGTVTEGASHLIHSDWVSHNGQFLLFYGSLQPGLPLFFKPEPISAFYGTGDPNDMTGIRYGFNVSSTVWAANRPGGQVSSPTHGTPSYDLTGNWSQTVTWDPVGGLPLTNPVTFNADGTFQFTGGLMETGEYYTHEVSGQQLMVMVFSNNNATMGGEVDCLNGTLTIDGISMQTLTFPSDSRRVGEFTMSGPSCP